MKRLSLRAPAKLNLCLKVINKRDDGFHNLETLFERIDLVDTLDFVLRKDQAIRITSDHPDVPLDAQNLAYRAARLLQTDFGLQNGVDIHIQKRIPVAAGLAGGSSNAATTLLALNQLWKLELTQKELLSYAQQLGSDVAFFLYDCSYALGTGKGDIIKPLNIDTKLWHILVVPSEKMFTKIVFAALNLELTKKKYDVNILIRSLRRNDLPAIGSFLSNDLEPTIIKLRPNLLKIKEKLRGLNSIGVAFSGSGPALFGITETPEHAQKLQVLLKKHFTQVYAVRTL